MITSFEIKNKNSDTKKLDFDIVIDGAKKAISVTVDKIDDEAEVLHAICREIKKQQDSLAIKK